MEPEFGKCIPDAVTDLTCPVCGIGCHPLKDTPLLAMDREVHKRGVDPFKRKPGWSLELARQGHFQWACTHCLDMGRALAARPWLQNWGDFDPFYAFVDENMVCASCDQEFLFSAREQQFWFEEKKFDVSSYPKECLPCRKRRRKEHQDH